MLHFIFFFFNIKLKSRTIVAVNRLYTHSAQFVNGSIIVKLVIIVAILTVNYHTVLCDIGSETESLTQLGKATKEINDKNFHTKGKLFYSFPPAASEESLLKVNVPSFTQYR